MWGSVGGWHFITPDGSIYKWDNSPRSALTGDLVTTLSSDFWDDLSLLHNAQPSSDFLITMIGQEVTGVNFGNSFGHNNTGSGNVDVSVSGSDVVITGDTQANTVVVFVGTDGSVMVQGAGGTTINGQNSAVPVAAGRSIGSLTADLQGGNDQVIIIDVNANNLNIDTDGGNDFVVINGVTVSGSTEIHSDSGITEQRILNSQLGSVSFWNNGLASVENSLINGALTANTSGTLFVQNSTVNGTTLLQTGNFNDNVIASNSLFRNNVTVDTRGGNDLLAFTGTDVEGDVSVIAGTGNDTIGVSRGSSVTGAATLRGNRGTDTFASDGTTGAVQLTGIESTINSNLDNLIDQALSNFTDLMLEFEQ